MHYESVKAQKIVLEELNNLIGQFQRNPYHFLYEAEIQAVLFARASEKLKATSVTIGGGAHDGSHYGSGTEVQTLPLHMEYPSDTRFDLAVLDGRGRSHRLRGDAPPLRNDAFWTQVVRFAVEVKYCQLGNRITECYHRLLADVEKMRRYGISLPSDSSFGGLGLLFVQSRDERVLDRIRDHLKEVAEVEASEEGERAYVIAPAGVYEL